MNMIYTIRFSFFKNYILYLLNLPIQPRLNS